jgi:hypothetical protein
MKKPIPSPLIRLHIAAALLLSQFLAGSGHARDIPVPEPLRPWMAWVLDRNPDLPCPRLPGNEAVCVAYSALELDLGAKGGTFRQYVTVYGKQWVQVPGSQETWPIEVDSKSLGEVPVVMRRGAPQSLLPQGEYELTGRFAWAEPPSSLGIPGQLARIGLRLEGRQVPRPEEDGAGKLLLGSKPPQPESTAASDLVLRVFRKLEDGIPMRLETVVRLTVSGKERQILTGRLLPPAATVMDIESDLPVRIEPDGRLRLQLLPGERTVRVKSRFVEPVARIAMERADSLWPAEEIWAFAAHPEIRIVELSGAPLIDPSQSGLPEEWKTLPAYRLSPGDTLRVAERQRGDSLPQAGTLELSSQMWLDFDGRGFTRKDRCAGRLYRRSRLEMRPGLELGRAELNGQPMMITVQDGKSGMEAAAGPLDLLAVSRGRAGGSLEAGGWNQGFKRIETVLHLPPGWSLFHADGPDKVFGSWISDWSLWDIFLVCILSLACLRMAGWRIGLLGIATFLLLSQEPGLGGLLWLNLLAAISLRKVLPAGKFRRLADFYRWGSLILLFALWVPFAITHARMALYPQLDGPGNSLFGNANANLLSQGQERIEPQAGFPEAPQAAPSEEMDQDKSTGAGPMPHALGKAETRSAGRRGSLFADAMNGYLSEAPAYAKVQTGPGEPAWAWKSARLGWSGPIRAGETFRLFLVPPWAGRLGRMLQALLPALLLLALAGAGGLSMRGAGNAGQPPDGGRAEGRTRKGKRPGFRFRMPWAVFLAAALGAPAFGQFPPDSLLEQLEERLSAPPACAPSCASLSAAAVALTGDRMLLSLYLDAADTTVADLPRPGGGQLLLEAIRLGGKPAAALRNADGGLAVVLPPGRHKLILEGRLLGSRLELAFGEAAHNITVDAPGYSLQGLQEGRAEGGTLVFQRRDVSARAEEKRALLPDPALPFVEVHRSLELAQEWAMVTRVIRVAPASGAFSVEIPIPAYEHPLSRNQAGQDGKVLVSFQEGADEASWRSTVDRRDSLRLAADGLASRAEIWTVSATSRWHLEVSGLAPVQAEPAGGAAEWRPLPGDTLLVRIGEPKPAGGPVKTIESASLSFAPGRHESSANLKLDYRAGQGDAARLTLPAGAKLEKLSLNGSPWPLTQREGTLSLPLRPGLQEIALEWKQAEDIRLFQGTPKVALGDAAANVSISLEVPGDRWILWVGGPRSGPALLLWGVLAILILIAYGLARARITPLGFPDWALLFAGTSTVNVYVTAPLLALFVLLRRRERWIPASPGAYNLSQAALGALALAAFGSLLAAVPEGLLSAPDMQVTGNGSGSGLLQWFADRADGTLPSGWMLSLPLWAYRMAMLAWSLWLAFRLLGWLRWCWERFSEGGLWKEAPHARKAVASPAPPTAPLPPANGGGQDKPAA